MSVPMRCAHWKSFEVIQQYNLRRGMVGMNLGSRWSVLTWQRNEGITLRKGPPVMREC